jgi:hypothetical protein
MTQSSDESSGRRPNANDVVSAMPALNRKARDRFRAIFFMAISRKPIRVMALAFARISLFEPGGLPETG